MSVEVRDISKTFRGFKALDRVSVTIATGELVALLGPSGSGKTTLLRIIAGLEQPDPGHGSIRFHDQDVADRHVRERRVGFVFQHYALFRQMTVFENIAFGLRVRPRRHRPPREQIRTRVTQLLGLVQLEGLAHRYPSQLSGGQRQRVALARALAVEPRVLLLDEPFGSLDAKVRRELRVWIRRLHDEIHTTSVFVTHDQDEALEVADRVVVLDQGRVEQIGTPDQVFHQPATAFVMNFLGQVNVFHGRIDRGQLTFGELTVAASDVCQERAGAARVFVRPHDLDLDTQPSGHSTMPVTVERVHAAGPTARLLLRTRSGQLLQAEMTQDRFRQLHLHPGVAAYVMPTKLRVFPDTRPA